MSRFFFARRWRMLSCVFGFVSLVTAHAATAETIGAQCRALALETADLGNMPAYDIAALVPTDDLLPRFPDHDIVYPDPDPEPERYEPDGPPRPSDNATGRLPIAAIHEELRRIYTDCTAASNAAFDSVPPEPGDTTHDHLDCGGCTLRERRNWRCGGYRMGVNAAYQDILKAKCNAVYMNAEEKCVLSKHERIDENGAPISGNPTSENGFFRCENEKEWFVQLPNYFFYNLEFNSLLNVSRNLYQTAEIRVYCDRADGWEDTLQPVAGGKQGTIKVVQLAPFSRYGGPGLAEQLLPPVESAVLSGLREQYSGKVAKMRHIIDVAGLSGSRCSSLGIDGDASIPLAQRNIVWDIPQPPVVTPVTD